MIFGLLDKFPTPTLRGGEVGVGMLADLCGLPTQEIFAEADW